MIRDNNLNLRAIELKDLDLLYEWENNMKLWRVSNTLTPFSKYQIEQYIKASSLDIYQTRQLRLMIDVIIDNNHSSSEIPQLQNSETVGIVDMFDFDPYHNRAGVGIMIHENYRNKGIASAAFKLFINYATIQLGIHNLYCNIEADNENSIKMMTGLGFELIGTKKEWLKVRNGYKDELMFQLIRD
ncbi:MAG: GNAT family N-acetyltransferase [Marinilabiliaceae bacterium]|nr:GNAT family N-acetyltransferase [Marinilabiliaceae bacterium]